MLAHAFIKQINSAAAASSSSRAQNASRGGGSGRAGLYASVQGPDVIWGQVNSPCPTRLLPSLFLTYTPQTNLITPHPLLT